MPVQTNKDIKANRSDIAVKDKGKRTSLLIAMSLPNEKETSLKTVEKPSKFKDLEVEIEKTWKRNHNNCPSFVPVAIGTLRLVEKGTENYISNIPGHIGITEPQKIFLLGSAHILRRSVSIK